MVLIDCGIVMVDGPGMMRESNKLDYLSAQVDYHMRAWHVDDWMDGIFWNEDWDHRVYILCSEMVEFKTKLRGIRASLNGKPQTRLIAGTLSTCNHLLVALQVKLFEIVQIIDDYIVRHHHNL